VKPEHPEKITDLPQVTEILFLLRKSSNEKYKEEKQHKQETTDNYAQEKGS
jgi:hypothetical protein